MSSVALAAAIAMVLVAVAGVLGLHALYTRAHRAMNSQRNSSVSATALTLLPAAASGQLDALGTLELRFRERVAATATLTAALDLGAGDATLARNLSQQLSRLGAFRQLLADLIAAPEPEYRRLASEACETFRLRWMVGSLLVTTEDKDPAVRVAACRAIAVTDPELAVGVLVRRIDADDAWAGALLETTVKRLGPDVIGALIKRAGVGTPSPAVLRVLAESPSLESLPLIEKALLNDNANLRAQAARAIPRTNDPRVDGIVDALMLDPVELVRLAAVHTMDADTSSGVLALVSALGDTSRVIRFAAATMLANNSRGQEALAWAAASKDTTVSEAAGAALWAIGGQNAPASGPALEPAAELVVEPVADVVAARAEAPGSAANAAAKAAVKPVAALHAPTAVQASNEPAASASAAHARVSDLVAEPVVDLVNEPARTPVRTPTITATFAEEAQPNLARKAQHSHRSRYPLSTPEAAPLQVSEAAEHTTESSVALLTRPEAGTARPSELHGQTQQRREQSRDVAGDSVRRQQGRAGTLRTPNAAPAAPAASAAQRNTDTPRSKEKRPTPDAVHQPAPESGSASRSTNAPDSRTRPSAVTRRMPARTTPSGPAPPHLSSNAEVPS